MEAPPGAGLSTEHGQLLDNVILRILHDVTVEDHPRHRPRHYALFVLTREGGDEERDHISTDVITSMEMPDLHVLLRGWLHGGTQ
jgi:hypothetical protein